MTVCNGEAGEHSKVFGWLSLIFFLCADLQANVCLTVSSVTSSLLRPQSLTIHYIVDYCI